ncbi:twin-arginine translocase subunit TatC [Neobacillus kokaensis]|uniref:Sec-independent protein translocase protein TatC n=1 Tax=Neobacillus kokaensis TaxID=2759023 RepID=A0ABQ3N664_9BACI|nr:twin-arginine translocase subunit TatC [Neobacillus kokaensis]GHH99556.1 Sec-independent protein translocase protein TatCd [Neobacillus kokaensis]
MNDKDLHVIGHLEELRSRIIKTLAAFIVIFIIMFIYVQDIYHWLIKDLDQKLAILGPGDIVWVYMMIAVVFSVAAVIPVAAYQIWKFVAPALKPEERKVTLIFIPFLFLLFLCGIGFGYFVLFPTVLGFLTSLSQGQFETLFTAAEYFRFMINLTLPFGLLFEMPLLVIFLTRLGILNPMRLAKVRKLSYFILIIISILVTPPDFMSDIMVTVPLLVLYELSVTLSKVVYRKRFLPTNEGLAISD